MADYVFGVKAQDVEEAAPWVAQATGLTPQARESSHKGGNYYSFDAPDHEELALLRNRDVHDDEPVVSFADEWEVVIVVYEARPDSPFVMGLLKDVVHFVLLKQWD